MKRAVLATVFLLGWLAPALAVQRFPTPEFPQTHHRFPETTAPAARAEILGWVDVAVLAAALALASYLALKRRSRRGLLLLGIFSLVYFGFWRKGCVCPVGAIQNVSLALFDWNYALSATVAIFFFLPLLFTLFFGRTFCAAVCPLGAVQDVVTLRSTPVPRWLEQTLRLAAFVYLGLAVLLAATGSAFVICQYDPFVAFFRLSGKLNMLVLGGCLLAIGLFIGRPYCRFLCPYGVILGALSRFSKWHVAITPDECIRCRLCEGACPYDAINRPVPEMSGLRRSAGRNALGVLIVLLPALVAGGVFLGMRLGPALARMHATVRLADRVWLEESGKAAGMTTASAAFRRSGQPEKTLYREALAIEKRMTQGGGFFGVFMGLAVGGLLIQASVHRRRLDYEPDQTLCVSCGRCFLSCPRERLRLGEVGAQQGKEKGVGG